MGNLIGLTGYAGAGKGSVANVLVRDFGYQEYGFADKVKLALLALDPLVDPFGKNDPAKLSYHCNKGYYLPGNHRLADRYILEGLNSLKRVSPEIRGLLQRMGTEAGRDILGPDVWVDALFNELDLDDDIVISDVRFANEARVIRDLGGQVWTVVREGVGPAGDHSSELLDFQTSLYINNSGSLEDLDHLVPEALQRLAA